LLGEDPVRHYIDGRIAEPISEADAADWQFVRTLTDSSAVDLVGDTQQLVSVKRGPKRESLTRSPQIARIATATVPMAVNNPARLSIVGHCME
jgi:hypothetical protein